IPLNERVEGLTFPEGLGAVLERAMRKNPEERYQTAIELAEALAPFADAVSHSASYTEDSGSSARAAPEAVVSPQLHGSPATAIKSGSAGSSPSTLTLLLVAVVCMVVGGLGAIFLMRMLGR